MSQTYGKWPFVFKGVQNPKEEREWEIQMDNGQVGLFCLLASYFVLLGIQFRVSRILGKNSSPLS